MNEIDRFSTAFAALWQRRLSLDDGEWAHLLTFLVDLQNQGHTALPLDRAEDLWFQTYAPRYETDTPAPEYRSIDFDRIPRVLFEDPQGPLAVRVDGSRTWVALRKKAQSERRLAVWFAQKTLTSPPWKNVDASVAQIAEDDSFSRLNAEQRDAVRLAFDSGLMILTGGPGTGKTTTLFQIVYQIVRAAPNLRVALCAPTGRAASRIQESLAHSYDRLKSDVWDRAAAETVRALRPTTLHRLIGVRGDWDPPTYRKDRTLPFNLVVVDEASMLDVRLLDRLTEALDEKTAVFFVGDPNQLPSVESGSALTSLLLQDEIQSRVARLVVNQRVAAKPEGLDALFRKTLEIEPEGVENLVASLRDRTDDFRWIEGLEETSDRLVSTWLKDQFRRSATAWVRSCTLAASLSNDEKALRVAACLETIQTHVLLTPVKDGAWGSRSLSAAISQSMTSRRDLVHPGLPWMVTRNLKAWELANGDRGVVLDDGGRLVVAFPKGSGYRTIAFNLLAADGEPSWAMTIHKSQGSEYRHVWIALPERARAFVTKEWLYTALTRARDSVTLVSRSETLVAALSRPMLRYSGFWRTS